MVIAVASTPNECAPPPQGDVYMVRKDKPTRIMRPRIKRDPELFVAYRVAVGEGGYKSKRAIGIRNQIIEQNMPLVGRHVGKLLRRGHTEAEMDDLIQAGALALARALEGPEEKDGKGEPAWQVFFLTNLLSGLWVGRSSCRRGRR